MPEKTDHEIYSELNGINAREISYLSTVFLVYSLKKIWITCKEYTLRIKKRTDSKGNLNVSLLYSSKHILTLPDKMADWYTKHDCSMFHTLSHKFDADKV